MQQNNMDTPQQNLPQHVNMQHNTELSKQKNATSMDRTSKWDGVKDVLAVGIDKAKDNLIYAKDVLWETTQKAKEKFSGHEEKDHHFHHHSHLKDRPLPDQYLLNNSVDANTLSQKDQLPKDTHQDLRTENDQLPKDPHQGLRTENDQLPKDIHSNSLTQNDHLSNDMHGTDSIPPLPPRDHKPKDIHLNDNLPQNDQLDKDLLAKGSLPPQNDLLPKATDTTTETPSLPPHDHLPKDTHQGLRTENDYLPKDLPQNPANEQMVREMHEKTLADER
jgi:hypothetical protein